MRSIRTHQNTTTVSPLSLRRRYIAAKQSKIPGGSFLSSHKLFFVPCRFPWFSLPKTFEWRNLYSQPTVPVVFLMIFIFKWSCLFNKIKIKENNGGLRNSRLISLLPAGETKERKYKLVCLFTFRPSGIYLSCQSFRSIYMYTCGLG